MIVIENPLIVGIDESKGKIAASILAFRKSMGLSQKALADRIGVTRDQIAGWETGRALPPPKAMQAYTAAGWSIDAPPPTATVVTTRSMLVTYPMQAMKYAGYLPAGDWGEALEGNEFEDVDARLWKANRFCARVQGDSCHPALQCEDFTVWEESKNPQFGKIVIAQRKGDHAATIKKLEWDSTHKIPVLLPVNPAHDQQEAEGWGAIAVLVYVAWRDEDGGEVTFYRPEGIKPSQLLKYRA